MTTSIKKALLSLNGLSVGDAFGEQFFSTFSAQSIKNRELPPQPWHWTDDTQMALSIVENLHQFNKIDQDALALAFAERFAKQPHRGYGGGAIRLLQQINWGRDWRDVSPALFSGGSFGNGGAMRAAPIGGFLSGDPERAAFEARKSAQVTHFHPEGQAGAMAVVAAAAIAGSRDFPTGSDFIDDVTQFVPISLTLEGLETAKTIGTENLNEAVNKLGTGGKISAQDTVPFCIWCAAHNLKNYEEALWKTVSGLGDRDTTCAIVGGIVALSAKTIPSEWRKRREPLPPDFNDKFGNDDLVRKT